MSNNGKRKRRTFSEEFKRDAVNLVVVEGYTIAAAAKAVNVLDGSLREWHRKFAPEPESILLDFVIPHPSDEKNIEQQS